MVGTLVGREVTVHGAGTGDWAQAVLVGNHYLVADEETEHGGRDFGPSPHEFLLAGLAACTAMTLRMYAARKKYPLQDVIVSARLVRDEALGEHGATVKRERVLREIRLVGPIAPDAAARMLEIAERCPVHRTLSAGLAIESRIVD